MSTQRRDNAGQGGRAGVAASVGASAGTGFLGHLVARVQAHAHHTPLSMLERRRPGLFEPRTRLPGSALETVDTVDAGTPSVAVPAMPSAPQSQAAISALRIATPPVAAPAATSAARNAQVATPQAQAVISVDPVAAAIPSSAHPVSPRADTAVAATRSPRRDAARESHAVQHGTSPAPAARAAAAASSAQAPIAIPQVIASRSVEKTHIERTLLESRMTVIERESTKHRDVMASVDAASPLRGPASVVRSEARAAPVAHPARSAALQPIPAPAAAAPAPVQVSIGRVEIRGVASPTKAAPTRSTASAPKLGLDEYLQQRHGSGR